MYNMCIYKYILWDVSIIIYVFQLRFRIYFCPNILCSEFWLIQIFLAIRILWFRIFPRPNIFILNFLLPEYFHSNFFTIRLFLFRIFCYPNFWPSEFWTPNFDTKSGQIFVKIRLLQKIGCEVSLLSKLIQRLSKL